MEQQRRIGPILPMHTAPASQAHDGTQTQSITTPMSSTQAHDGTQTPAGQSNTQSDGNDPLSSLTPKTGQKPHTRGDTKEPAHNTPEMV